MAAVALVVAMLAQLKTRDQWLALLGNRVTHHYVLLDDSYSMSDRALGASAFDAAQQVIRNIVGRAKTEDSPQKFTLLRFSRARGAAASGAAAAAAQRADFNAEPVDGAFDLTLEKAADAFGNRIGRRPPGCAGAPQASARAGQRRNERRLSPVGLPHQGVGESQRDQDHAPGDQAAQG
jgi:hypothetical protein